MQQLDIVEVFSSIQGEGKYVGYRQVFVRLAGCNAVCAYCDTPSSRQPEVSGQIEITAGGRDFSSVDNPVTMSELADRINWLLKAPHHSVSFTGGEPLCQAEALVQLLPLVKGRIFLETNGTLPDELALVLPYVDIISMDIKLPSSARAEYWQEHERFLRLAAGHDLYVKIVVSGETGDEEFFRAVRLIAAVDARIPLVIQPVTPVGDVSGIAPETVGKLQATALQLLQDVRVIPQTHKFIGQM
ncbi:MAG: 7-carboxy-7-deazaguanine synthase QueE [Negativicutes bacterium]|nr:7-carboxy-7-deazaguanine synthase QueE [Negativicutes bacterium]